MEGTFQGTGFTELDLDQDPQAEVKNKTGKFYEADLHKACDRAHVKVYETVTITSISRQTGNKLHAQKKKPLHQVSIQQQTNTTQLNQELLRKLMNMMMLHYLEENPWLLNQKETIYGYEYLGVSTATGHTNESKLKQTT